MDDCWDEDSDENCTTNGNSNSRWENKMYSDSYVQEPKRNDGAGSQWGRESYFSDRSRTQEQQAGNAGRQFSRNNDRNSRYSNNEDSTELQVDSVHVGKIIGRGGSKIKELQEESGARIKVIQEDRSASTACVRLFGASEACEKAKQLIEELTSDFRKFSTAETPKENYSYTNNTSNGFCNFSSAETPQESYSYTNSSGDQIIDWDLLNARSEEARKKKLAALPRIMKDFYHEDIVISKMTPKEVAAFRAAKNSISVLKVKPDDQRSIPNPISAFEHAFKHYPELLRELKNQGFTTPSPIQCQAWPIIMKGYDMIGIAQTGTGKTISFLFPALVHIVGQVTPREKRVGPSCLILAPTRELAQQIETETKKYSYHGISCVCVYGGGSRRNQIGFISKGVDIVIATPGRLNDLVMNNIINVTGVTYLVLDEADRMLDLGFEPQIRKILLDVRPDRQTIMTSATWTSSIQELAAKYMTDPFKVNVGALNLAAVHSVTQEIIFAEDDDRRALMKEFLDNMGPQDKAIVFVERKSIADDISSDLILRGVECQSIHGDREQYDREQALNDLKTGYVRILIATDVASRGLDIKDITHIFNMYFPRNIEEYVHRVGRTGRAGRKGTAISIFTRQDWMHAEPLIKILEEADQFVPDELYNMADRYRAWKRKKDAEDAACGGRRFRGKPRRF
ncbi:probable ATP-dependent RNA helicase DDX43 [Uloborus diversus]|uniref:probable ATP-dependent RNA helicase DDX43 n=1 Tax=Uloborus diversus TaxID=327109 RepID=UPI00240A3C61|nr:probable ATP-dependent RNA helicase DDX43 [Uloborus diversus]